MRLTGSGLGCPTWPRCTDQSFVPHGALGIHGAIEFGNRMLTFVLAAVAIATLRRRLALRPARRSAGWPSLLALGVPAQAVIGGITVLTDLNPWVVSFHLLVSLAMVGLAVVLLRRLDEGDRPARPTGATGRSCWLARAIVRGRLGRAVRRHRRHRQRPARRRRRRPAQRPRPALS